MLDEYITDTQALLHDTSGLFTPVAQLTRYINMARRQVAYQTGCLRILVAGNAAFGTGSEPGVLSPGVALPGQQAAGTDPNPVFNMVAGVERYPFSYGGKFAATQNAGIKGIVDVATVSVNWGGVRPMITWLPWSDLQAYGRSYNTGVTSYPFYWSTFGDGENGEVWLFPVPTVTAEWEWDACCVPLDLTSNNQPEALPHPFRNAIKFYAAHLAYIGSQRPAYSQMMLQMFHDNIGVGRVASDRGKQGNAYWQSIV